MKLTSTFKCKLVVLCCLMLSIALMFGAMFSGNSKVVFAAESDAQKPTIVSVAGIAIGSSNMGGFPSAIVGEEYKSPDGENYKVVATGTGPLTYSANEYATGGYGEMPQGLHLNSETGEFSGTITSQGEFNVLITVSNEYGSTGALCRIKVFNETDKPTITTENLPNGAVGSYYSQTILYSGYPTNSPTCEVVSGSLPTGLAFGTQYGDPTVYGKPTETGTFTFTLSVNNGAGTATKEYSIEITDEAIRPSPLKSATIINESDTYSFIDYSNRICIIKGKPVSIQLVSSGTNTTDNPITYKTDDDLPSGLTMSASGLITGTTTESVETNDSYKDFDVYVIIANKKVDGSPQSTATTFTIRVYENGYVQSINLTPNATTVAKGAQRQFSIDWSFVYGDVNKTDLTWSIFDGALPTSESTTLSNTGLLNIGIDETIVTLWIKVKHNPSGKETSSIVTIIDHTHTTEVVEATPKTCTTDGNIKHYKCTICDGLFSDALAITTLTEVAVKVSAGHEYGTLITKQDATCSSTGTEAHYECSVCHLLFNSSHEQKTSTELEIEINPTSHNFGTMTIEVPATCAEEGTKAHKTCEYCHEHFDNDGVKIDSLIIAKNDNHLKQDVWSKDSSGHYHACTRVGCKDGGKLDFASHTPSAEAATETTDVHCTVCGFVISPVQSHVHGLKLVPGQSQTCTKDGTKSYYVCSEGANPCGKYFADKDGSLEIASTMFEEWKVIPASHTFGEWVQASQPNCAKTGEVAHKTCSVCKKHFDDKNVEIKDIVIPQNNLHVVPNTQTWSSDQLGHWHACVREGCKDNGKADYVAHTRSAQAATETTDIHCTVCQFIIEAPKGHVHNLKFIPGTPASCTKEGTKAYYVCSEGANPCGKYFEDKDATTEIPASRLDSWKVISVTHNFDEWVQGFAATCASEGEAGHKTCSVCKKNFDADGKELTSIVLPKNHNHQTNSVWVKDETGHWYVCTREGCKDGGIVDFAPHTKSATAPTERDDVHCLVCLFVIQNTTAHVHGLKLVPGTPASCTTAGEKDYYQCTEGTYPCYNYFADAQGTMEIASADLGEWKVIAAGHTFGEWQQGFEANCTQTGEVAHKTCSACNKHFDADGNEIENIVIAINQNHVASSEWLHDETGHWHVCGQQGCTFDGKLDFAAHSPSAEQATKDNDVHCTVCQLVLQEALASDGLSGGAIAGIAVGSTVVAAGGGFSVFWFVIKKKKFADLVAIFKK